MQRRTGSPMPVLWATLALLACAAPAALALDPQHCVPPVLAGALHPAPGLYLLPAAPSAEPCSLLDADVAKASAPESAVLLVHGLDDSGEVWHVLAPALRDAGRPVLFFEYPNDQAISASADALADSLRLARSRGVEHVDLVCHSMGGLVARDVLTRDAFYAGAADGHADLPDIDHLILIGTPNAGAPLAYIRDAGELVERTIAWRHADASLSEILDFGSDGDGQAGIDLRPGSAFLNDLNARPAPAGVITTVIIAQAVGQTPGSPQVAPDPSATTPPADSPRRGVRARLRVWWSRVVARVVEALGDGAVPTSSATLASADETLFVHCSHLGLLKDDPVGGWILDNVGADRQSAPAVSLVLDRVAGQVSVPVP